MKYSFSYTIKPAKVSAESLWTQAQNAQKIGQLPQAVAFCEQALAIEPRHLNGLQFLGSLSLQMGDFEKAAQCFLEVTRLVPGFAEAYRNRGMALAQSKRYGAAKQCFEEAILLEPKHIGARYNRAVALEHLLQLKDAIQAYLEVLGLDPNHEMARWNMSVCQLLEGNLIDGFRGFEARWANASFRTLQGARTFAQPQWTGEASLSGKTILVHAEQGLGDTIQFVRYVKILVEKGAMVILEVQPPLVSFLRNSEIQARIICRGDALPSFDCHAPLLSLPFACRTELSSIPSMNSYLHVSTEVGAVWKERIGNDAKANIGIVWQGSTTHADDEDRSIKLDALIAALPQGPTYHTLQPDLSREDIERLAGYPNVIQWGQYLTDFEQTAGAIEAMDLIVSVDTSVAHAAAALGRPVLLLVANHPDWRWLLDRDDSPWYPSVRLVRQTEPGEWDGVMQRLPNEIQARLNRDSYRRPSH